MPFSLGRPFVLHRDQSLLGGAEALLRLGSMVFECSNLLLERIASVLERCMRGLRLLELLGGTIQVQQRDIGAVFQPLITLSPDHVNSLENAQVRFVGLVQPLLDTL